MTLRRLALSCLFAIAAVTGTVATVAGEVPEFTHSSAADWINSAPLTLQELRGKVVLIEFWTFDCYNCRNTLPWLKAIHAEYAPKGLAIVSVHTPELPQERNPANVHRAVKELGITYPVMIDADFSYWQAMNNRYWPAFYLVGRDGTLVETAIGELHREDRRGKAMEEVIRNLLAK